MHAAIGQHGTQKRKGLRPPFLVFLRSLHPQVKASHALSGLLAARRHFLPGIPACHRAPRSRPTPTPEPLPETTPGNCQRILPSVEPSSHTAGPGSPPGPSSDLPMATPCGPTGHVRGSRVYPPDLYHRVGRILRCNNREGRTSAGPPWLSWGASSEPHWKHQSRPDRVPTGLSGRRVRRIAPFHSRRCSTILFRT